jgi:putative acetyltransferase
MKDKKSKHDSIIRKFEPADMDEVLKIWLEASIEAHDFVKKEFWESQLEAMRTEYIPASDTFVYTENKKVKGFISLSNQTLAAIFVAPDARGKGIGTQLMNKAKSLKNSLNLTVYKLNTKSGDFYKKHGFKITRERTCDHTGQAELVMEYSLNDSF